MPINYINHWNDIFDKLENVIATEFGNAMPVFIGDETQGSGSQYLRIEPVNNTLLEYHSHGQIREYAANIFVYFKEKKIDERTLESILNVSARLEKLIFNNINMTTDYADNIYDCRLDSVDLNVEPDNEEYYVISAEWSGTLNSVDTIRTSTAYSVLFDGDDYIDNPDSAIYEEASIECWFKCPDVVGKYRALFDGTGTDVVTTPITLYIAGTHTGKISVNTGTGGWKRGSANLADGEWHHMIFTFAKNGSAANYDFFIDGASAGGDFPLTGVGSKTGVSIANIARDNAGTASYAFKGNMAGLALWDRVLSDSEKRSLYNNGVPVNLAAHSTASDLKHWWRMGNGTEDGSGSTIYDMKGGSSYNATLSGASIVDTGVTT